MKFATASARRLISLGVGLAVGAAVLGVPAAAAAPPEGAYWHTRTLTTTTHPWRFGTKSHPYSLLQQEITERWTAPDGRSWSGYRELGSLPKSAADKKAWQRDGSPAKWTESIDGKTVKLSTQPAKGRVDQAPPPNSFFFAEQWLTYDEVQRLPADPDRLKAWVAEAGRVGRENSIGGNWLSALPEILYDLPAPKEVRVAAYQALLTMPGVRAEGNAKDKLGRSGTVLLIDRPGGKGTVPIKMRLIVDTGRMALLSQDDTVTYPKEQLVIKTSKLVESGWTDSPPAVPALP
ncbi:hypothetical protein [Nonomuraea cavernae]|uniref:Uncharacterized protein n=1 Tax=Nonomuraea cavernae TaxID=2045107 RepID=A0A918DLT3_9ACTN|nr:hypothetical protein [Nonomuraea cavernae]MCA2188224.1 hypothetical protein [Nonomuraea cavernae]GGO73952.1 hypothetical protein GCM10012289_45480 [Nonomuraea cavernae]